MGSQPRRPVGATRWHGLIADLLLYLRWSRAIEVTVAPPPQRVPTFSGLVARHLQGPTMVAGQNKAGIRACTQRAAWQTWLGPRASPVDRSVIESTPDDVFLWILAMRNTTSTVQTSKVHPRICGSLHSPASNVAAQSAVLQPTVLHGTQDAFPNT